MSTDPCLGGFGRFGTEVVESITILALPDFPLNRNRTCHCVTALPICPGIALANGLYLLFTVIDPMKTYLRLQANRRKTFTYHLDLP